MGWFNPLATWLQHFLGFASGDGNGSHYLFVSGSGSIILPPILNAVAIGAIFWWHHQCHVTGCWWYARRTTAAGERACFRHHPHPKRTEADIHQAHHRALKTSSDERNSVNQRPVMFRAGGTPRGIPLLAAGRTYLCDCSEFQASINDPVYLSWSKAIVIRGLYGANHVDLAWYGGARRDDLHAGGAQFLGIYQYVAAGQDAAAQAQALVSLLGPLRPGEIPICDLEEGSGDQSGRWDAWRTVILDAYPQLKDTPLGGPMLYSGLYFAATHNLSPHWVADYSSTAPAMPHTLWQFTDAFQVPGVGIADCSVFVGSVAQLRALITPKAAPQPPPPPQPAPSPAPEDFEMLELDSAVAAHPLLIPFGSPSIDLLTVATEAAPVQVTVTWLDQGANPVGETVSWGGAGAEKSIPVPAGIKKARLDITSGGGPRIAVRFNPPLAS